MFNFRRKHLALAFIFLCGLVLSGCVAPQTTPVLKTEPPVPSPPAGVVYHNLSEITDAFARELAADLSTANKIYLDRSAIRDTITKDVYNFSAYLQNELESSLSQHACTLVYDPDEADRLIGAAFRKSGDQVRIYFKYHHADMSGRKSLDYSIQTAHLPEDAFVEDMKSMAFKLVTDILAGQEKTKVYIRPIVEGKDKYLSDFSKVFTARVKTEIVRRYREVEIIDEQPIQERLSDIRGVGKTEKATPKNLESTEARFANADSVLEGKYFQQGKLVTVNLFLKRVDGRLLNSASVDIPQVLITSRLDNSEAKKLTELADIPTETGDANVRIFTTKGGDFPVYYNQEKIKFYIQVSRPLYVYLYDINASGEVTLLYPYDSGDRQSPLQPEKIYTLPAETDDFEFEVEPPFGMDAVKIFASRVQLPIPELSARLASQSYRGGTRNIGDNRGLIQVRLSGMRSINPKDLVDYYRGVAREFGGTLYEDSVMLETREKR